MTPHPGAPRANTSRLRCLLAALLLTVLTLAGGTATADAAVPALANAATAQAAGATSGAGSGPTTGTVSITGRPPGAGSGPATGPAATTGTGSEARHAVGPDRHVEDRRWPDRRAHDRQGPDHAYSTAAGPGAGAVARAEHEHPRAAADPAQTPRAGSGRAYLLVHAPPPPHDVLAPAAPGPAVPRGGVRLSAADSFDVPGSRSGALPDVRGPPSRATGPTTGHAFRTAADPASRPH
ncbi:hypothetical protein [Streptomyces sp. sk226]|uniref:hypothetical protein n=1 Tax=Streptomyces sp. sk226 TaxID=2034268 RepID=UPI000BEFADAA|nr:hypothetical protein [Streptomyces sp. sk226]